MKNLKFHREFLLIFIFLNINIALSQAAKPLSVYLSPHQDDFFLFMGERMQYDLKVDTANLVFIFLTDGDAARVNYSYTTARNEGAREAIRFLGDYFSTNKRAEKIDTVSINSHRIQRFQYRGMTAYFMNLPCGYFDVKQKETPLGKFMNGDTAQITSRYKLSTYTSWKDLVLTVDSIIKKNYTNNGQVILNSFDYNITIDKNDHPDHNIVGELTKEVALENKDYRGRYYLGYTTTYINPNTDAIITGLNIGMFANYDRIMRLGGWMYSMTSSQHIGWQSRSYWRDETFVDGNSTIKMPDYKINILKSNQFVYLLADTTLNGEIIFFDIAGKIISKSNFSLSPNVPQKVEGRFLYNNIYIYQVKINQQKTSGKIIY